MNKPYWNILIKRLKAEGKIKVGLTIPYLHGAYQILGFNVNTIQDLLSLILESNAKEYPIIERCDVILQDVVKFEERSHANRYRKNEFAIPNKERTNKLFISYNTNLGNSLEKVCEILHARYQTPINNVEFSWNNKSKKWQKFEKEELDFIKSLK